MAWEIKNSYYSGQGVALLGDRDPVTHRGINFLPVGNVSDLKISIATSVLEHKESTSGVRGIDLRLTTEVKASASMVMENFNAANMALALRGESTNVAAGAVTDEPGKFAAGMVMPLDRIKVTSLVVKKASTVLVQYVAGTGTAVDGAWDYKANLDAGSIMWAPVPVTALLVDGDVITSSYTAAAQKVVDALTKSSSEKFLRFEGLNTADGNDPVVVEAFRFLLDPAKEYNLITDAVQKFTLDGSLLFDADQTGSNYFRQIGLK